MTRQKMGGPGPRHHRMAVRHEGMSGLGIGRYGAEAALTLQGIGWSESQAGPGCRASDPCSGHRMRFGQSDGADAFTCARRQIRPGAQEGLR
jgi:hypothetical protein